MIASFAHVEALQKNGMSTSTVTYGKSHWQVCVNNSLLTVDFVQRSIVYVGRAGRKMKFTSYNG